MGMLQPEDNWISPKKTRGDNCKWRAGKNQNSQHDDTAFTGKVPESMRKPN